MFWLAYIFTVAVGGVFAVLMRLIKLWLQLLLHAGQPDQLNDRQTWSSRPSGY